MFERGVLIRVMSVLERCPYQKVVHIREVPY